MPTKEKAEPQIVVVDDSAYSRKGIVECLESEGFSVVGEAANAEDALRLTGNSPCNLMIIDVVMPEASGLELAQLLTDQKTEIAMIMISSLRMENVIIESISAGAMDYLQKPFEKTDLIRSVKKVFQEWSKENG